MGLDRTIDITAEQRTIVLQLLKRHLPNTTAWIYGSRAKWTSRPQSDLDLVVFATPEQNGRVSNLRQAFEESNLPFRVDLFVWDAVPEQFRKHIKRDHEVLVEREERDATGEWRETVYGRFSSDFVEDCLVNLCDPINGVQTGPFGSQLHKKDYVSVGTPIITVEHLGDNRILHEDVPRVSDHDRERLSKYILHDGDVVFSRVGSVDRRALVKEAERGWLFSGRCLRVRPDPNKIDSGYLSYFFGLPSFKEHIRAIAVGATMPSLNTQILSDIAVPHPRSLNEQRAIAHILGTLDDKIELNRRMNATLEALARALFTSWFVDFDPVRAKMESRDTGLPKDIADLFPDRLVDSELGEIPEGWRVGHVEDGFEIIMGQSPPGHTYNDTGDGLPFFQGRSDFGFRYPKNRKFCTAPNRIAQPWDMIVSIRAPVGDINMAWEPCCIGRGVAALRPRSGAVSFGYCTAQTLQPHMREYEHTGTVFGAINRKQLARLPLQQPAADVVRAFEDLVHPWDQTIRLRTAQGDTLTALRDALLPKLVSGELRTQAIHWPQRGVGSQVASRVG